jgi:hypothetical protein
VIGSAVPTNDDGATVVGTRVRGVAVVVDGPAVVVALGPVVDEPGVVDGVVDGVTVAAVGCGEGAGRA